MTAGRTATMRSSILVFILAVGVLFVLLYATGLLTPSEQATGTIKGTVIRSPTEPVCREGQQCWAPAAGLTVTISSKPPGTVHKVVTDSEGFYSIQVPAGTYTVSVPAAFPAAQDYVQEVSVEKDRIVIVNFDIDTGIR